MSDSKDEGRKLGPVRRAALAGLIAGIAAAYVSYLFVGILGFVIGFIVGALVGSRTVLLMARAKVEVE